MKLDMKKAFDRINWAFLLKVLGKFGFATSWIQWVSALISDPCFSILINGSARGYFKSSRGLHQGDPLSPYLFILVAEALGRGLRHLQASGKIKGLQINNLCKAVTHSQFADDTLLAIYPSVQEIHQVKNLLNAYEKASGQAVNYTKSKLYGINLSDHLLCLFSRLTRMSSDKFPSTYLGLPLFQGGSIGNYWDILRDKLTSKLAL